MAAKKIKTVDGLCLNKITINFNSQNSNYSYFGLMKKVGRAIRAKREWAEIDEYSAILFTKNLWDSSTWYKLPKKLIVIIVETMYGRILILFLILIK